MPSALRDESSTAKQSNATPALAIGPSAFPPQDTSISPWISRRGDRSCASVSYLKHNTEGMGLSQGGSIALGILVGITSTCIQSLGLTLQRKSHILEEQQDDDLIRRPPYRRRRWQLGMLMFIVANLVGSTIQITTLPLPVLSTLQASGLVFNSIAATLILSESFTRYSLIGTILVTIGAALIATFGSVAESSHTLVELLRLLNGRGFLLWLFGTLILAAAVAIGTHMLENVQIPNRWLKSRRKLVQGLAYGAVSGILSAHTLLIAKSAVELLVRTIVDGINQFNRWQSWMILVALVAFALSQLYYLHRGLKLASTSVLYPFVFCIYNIVAILDGLIYFRQASRLSVVSRILIFVGTFVLLSGVMALSWRLDEESRDGNRAAMEAGYEIVTEQPEYGTCHAADTTSPFTPTKLSFPPPNPLLGPGLGMLDAEPAGADSLLREEESTPNTSNEQTPLIVQRRRQSKHLPRKRRMTLAVPYQDEGADIWGELNESAGRNFSGSRSSSQLLQSSTYDESPVDQYRGQRRSSRRASGLRLSSGGAPRFHTSRHSRSSTLPTRGDVASPSLTDSMRRMDFGNLVGRLPVDWFGQRRSSATAAGSANGSVSRRIDDVNARQDSEDVEEGRITTTTGSSLLQDASHRPSESETQGGSRGWLRRLASKVGPG